MKLYLIALFSLAKGDNLLDLVSLQAHPQAQCNDGTPAVYYRRPLNSETDVKKLLIYLKGGGMCVPLSPGGGCVERCKDNDPLCTAATDPHLDLEDHYSDSIFSLDPEENPAFHDYNIAYVPYCSSDWYTGTRNASVLTEGFVFHGKYIVMAIIEDLLQNTWITEAEEVVLTGVSAGGLGVDANCDLLADNLHSFNPDIKVKCISDSGSLYPLNTHSTGCLPQYSMFMGTYIVWESVLDESCVQEIGWSNCGSITKSYPHVNTPMLLLHSATDTVIRFCTEDSPEFWQQWRDEMAGLGRQIAGARPDIGLYIVNCPFHGAYSHSYANMEVPLIDSDIQEDKILLRDILYNFIHEQHPYQAIDDMSAQNINCSDLF